MAQISTLWVPPCSRAGPSARSRARAKFQGKEGRAGRGRRAQLGGKIQQLLVVGTYRCEAGRYSCRLGYSGVGVRPCLPSSTPARRATSVSPSWGRARGQCEVVRGKRQQLDELEFLSGRGAGGGRSWQGQPTIGDGWTEGSCGLFLACCLQAACAYRLSSVVVKNHHHF